MAGYQLFIAYSPYNCGDREIRVRIDCVGTLGLDSAIFVYRRYKESSGFSHIASTVDMVEIPVEADCSEVIKWERRTYVDILVRSPKTAYDFVADVESDVRYLYKNMEKHNTLLLNSSVIVGADNIEAVIAYTNTSVVIRRIAGDSVYTLDSTGLSAVPISRRLIFTPVEDMAATLTYTLNGESITCPVSAETDPVIRLLADGDVCTFEDTRLSIRPEFYNIVYTPGNTVQRVPIRYSVSGASYDVIVDIRGNCND